MSGAAAPAVADGTADLELAPLTVPTPASVLFKRLRARAGLDPPNLLIDVKPHDNVEAVKRAGELAPRAGGSAQGR